MLLNLVSSSAFNSSPSTLNIAVTLNELMAVNSRISRSRSTINLTETDWTLPADNPARTFFHSTGDNSYPTKRSRMRRACWASTRFISTVLGFFMASSIAGFVIS